MNRSRMSLWLIGAAVYGVFALWYSNTGGPLTTAEIARYTALFEARGITGEQKQTMTQFMTTDTGRQIIVINNLDLNESPIELPATGPNASAGELIDHYMEHMYPAQLKRASHPVFFGRAISPAIDLSGIVGGQNWDQGALFRYRSRRDLLEIATDPAFSSRHDYKMAALEKTIAYPVESVLYLSDLRLLLLLVLLNIVLVLDLALFRRRSR